MSCELAAAAEQSLPEAHGSVEVAGFGRFGPAPEVFRADRRLDLAIAVRLAAIAAVARQEAARAADFDGLDAARALHPARVLRDGVFHEASPDRRGELARVSARHDRAGLIEADPHGRHEGRGEPDEPRILVVVGRAGLAAGRVLEPGLAR